MYKDKIRYLDLSLDEEYKIEKIDEMKSSIFRDIYRKAITVIKSLTESKRSDIAPRGAIITFMGERGCGKTSVLNSFLRSLEMPGELDASLKDTRFITLDLVDASLFEAGEDLFEVILAKMLEKLDVLNKERRQFHGERYDRENLNQKFNDIFETHRMLDGAQKQELLYGHSPLAALRHLYSSEQLKGEFEILVDKYLSEYEQVRDRQSKDSFLVIAIDDLDMNIKYAFSMLEQIYRYLTVRKVIILLAVKYEQLEIICKKNFSMMVPHLAIADNGYSSEYVGATSRSYLDKVLPLQTRIHIPAINDYAEKFYSHIHIKNERALIKEAILGKISRRIGVYFDGCGDKMHFMIPDTLRGLNDYYAFLKTLPKLVKEDDLDKLQYNCSRFLSDFTNRFVFEYLSENDRNEYMKAIRLDARSRNNYLYSIIKKRIDTDSEDLQYYPFGYGNMLRAIYLFSVDNLENKKFGRVIMALYSVLLSRIFSVLQVNTEAEMRKNACGERDVLCKGSWGGVWPNACLPYVKVKGADNDAIGNYSFGYITSIIPDMARLGLHFKPSGPSYVPKGLEQAKKWIVDHRKELRTVEIFFTL